VTFCADGINGAEKTSLHDEMPFFSPEIRFQKCKFTLVIRCTKAIFQNNMFFGLKKVAVYKISVLVKFFTSNE
jgi:hypothetical protein